MFNAKQPLIYSLTAIVLTFASLFLLTGANESRSYKPLTQNTFIEVARAVQPAVVSISVSGVNERQKRMYEEFRERFPQDPFHRFLIPNPDARPQGPGADDSDEMFKFRQAGSGVIIRENGYILTNRHVIQNAAEGELTIALKDGQEFSGKDVQIIGTDELTDLAVLKVNGNKLPVARLGNSDELQIGQWVLAMGDPLELRNSVTEGIISGLGRDIHGAMIRDYIQTTAIINPGNSGGPLVNLENEVVGINVLISTNNGLWQGVAFAIPANIARQVSDDLISRGKVVRGYVGVSMRWLHPEFKQFTGYEGEGVWVYGLTTNGPALRAGLQVDDIVVEIDGVKIEDMRTMLREVAVKKVGSSARFKVFRNGEYKEFDVAIDERPADPELDAIRAKPLTLPEPVDDQPMLGVQVTETPDERMSGENKTVLEVTQVKPQSPAAQAGIQPGDLIYEVNGRRVHNLEEMRAALKEREQDTLIKLHRGDNDEFVILTHGKQ